MFLHWQTLSTGALPTTGNWNFSISGFSVNVMTKDSSGYIYLAGSLTGTGPYIIKLSSQGVIQWQKALTGSNPGSILGIYADSANNIYLTGDGGQVSGVTDLTVFKFNSSGTLLWQTKLGNNTQLEQGGSIVTDASGNVYVTGSAYKGTGLGGVGTTDGILVKFNSSGTLQWQKYVGQSGYYGYLDSLAINSAGNIVVAGGVRVSTANALLLTFDTAGTLLSTVNYGPTQYGGTTLSAIAKDTLGNFIIVGTYNWQTSGYTGYGRSSILKVSGSGGQAYWKAINTGYDNCEFFGVVTDSANNFYACGYIDGNTSTQAITVYKFNSSGVIQWARRLDLNNTQYEYGSHIVIDETNGFIFLLIRGGSQLVFRLPLDGSGIGTYGQFTYSDMGPDTLANMTAGSGANLVTGVKTLPVSSPSLTVTTPTLIPTFNFF